ncbi:MAG: hydantoinase/oxoprolinase family protein [Candidatus Latescibacteria bacterium]|jgi:N-methylhydantoinase A|nr:hydantoinase/oxoprolinase family protein [Candidatus Latescibacterota bacterium]
MSYRLGVDVGGTFTDLLLFNDTTREMVLAKVPSTPANQAEGIMDGLAKVTAQAGISPADIASFMHGTTVATNAILEGKGAKTALIVTEGFRDVLHIMRQDRPSLYDFFARRPDALIPRHLRFEISERTLHTGEVAVPLDEGKLAEIIEKIREREVTAIAVCLLHAYVNPSHERAVEKVLRRGCPDVEVSISSEILPEIKEYERMSTTAINASVVPIVDRYLKRLRSQLSDAGADQPVHIMQSSGGIMPASEAGRRSASTILSGPAAGVLGGVALAKQAGFKNVITVDMGGTSFDICLADRWTPRFTRASEIGGHALSIPMIDIHTIGAGGGSIAWIDQGGVLKTGPESASADPGPVCYDKGGDRPTVTDANLVLGRLDPHYFLGGEMEVDQRLAYEAIERTLAKPLGMGVLEVAEGVIRVVNANMARGIRFVSVEKGYDPRDFGMVCFGGSGPLHGAELAEELAIPEVVVPFAPGVNCAYGLLMADFRQDHVRTHVAGLADTSPNELSGLYSEMAKEARQRMKGDVPGKSIVITRSLDMRYHGQGYELEVPVPDGRITRKSLADIERKFHALHRRSYGFDNRDEATELVNLRITATGLLPKPKLRREKEGDRNPGRALKERRRVFLKGRHHDVPIYDRNRLNPGARMRGPAIIEQRDSTILVFPRQRARIDRYRNLIITVGAKR